MKSVDINSMLEKALGTKQVTPAFVYGVEVGELAGDVVVSLETGHVVSVQGKNPEVLRFCLDAHFAKVYQAHYARFDPYALLTLSADHTFALWTAASQILRIKIKLDAHPNACLTLASNKVILGDVTPDLKIYDLPD